MNTDALLRRFHEWANLAPEQPTDPDSLIGFFQNFRPDGKALEDLFDDLDLVGDLEAGDSSLSGSLSDRLESLYEVAGDDRRPQGGRDAYFVVRGAKPIDPDVARDLATQWLTGVRDLAVAVDDAETVAALDPTPTFRVLEGGPPKHPKAEVEKSNLLRVMQLNVPALVEKLDVGPHPAVLRPAYYFVACDPMLRDYLMWPLYAAASGQADPMRPYFRLWSHGVKYRIFGDSEIDLYLPRAV
jgi:hypothetical protein